MRLLYVASNPQTSASLGVDHDVTIMQRYADLIPALPLHVEFQPALPFAQLPGLLHEKRPDILHLAAHGASSGKHLEFADHEKRVVRLTSAMLRGVIDKQRPPKLIYFNACDSAKLAQDLVGTVEAAIGANSRVGARAARDSAIAFYERLLRGTSLQSAFDAASTVMQGAMAGKAQLQLHVKEGIDPRLHVLRRAPTLVAEFDDKTCSPDKRDGHYDVFLGLMGAPEATRQVVFFTDEASFIRRKQSLEDALCHVLRDEPRDGFLFLEEPWRALGDIRLYAAASKADGTGYVVSGRLCDALEARYLDLNMGIIPERPRQAIEALRKENRNP